MPASENRFRREEHEVDLCVAGGGTSGRVTSLAIVLGGLLTAATLQAEGRAPMDEKIEKAMAAAVERAHLAERSASLAVRLCLCVESQRLNLVPRSGGCARLRFSARPPGG